MASRNQVREEEEEEEGGAKIGAAVLGGVHFGCVRVAFPCLCTLALTCGRKKGCLKRREKNETEQKAGSRTLAWGRKGATREGPLTAQKPRGNICLTSVGERRGDRGNWCLVNVCLLAEFDASVHLVDGDRGPD